MPFLQFKGRTAVESYHYSLPHHTLELEKDLSVLHSGQEPSLDGNLIIEGDNLLALKALLPTHAGQVKCIYIDPPYNTGNEAWVYNDNLNQPQFKEWIGNTVGKEGDDAARHDKWCCMMFPRLNLLHQLLCEDGILFVSIDDTEVGQLRLLLDEIFGADNFVATIIWQKNFSPKNSAQWFSDDHDYIVAYAKTKNRWRPILTERTEGQLLLYTNPDNDPRGPWASGDLSARNPYSKGIYPVVCPGGRSIDGPPPGTYWRVEETKLWDLHRDNRIWWGEDQNGVPRLKRFLSDVKEGITPRTIWLHGDAGNTQEAKKDLNEIIPVEETVFQTPKPMRLMEKLFALGSSGDDLVLDSFAGSGTSGQSVLRLNALDGGKRRFILIQQPYDTKDNEVQHYNICRRLTAERIRRTIEGYAFAGNKVETLLEEKVGLNVLKNPVEILHRIEEAKQVGKAQFDEVRAEMKDGVVRVEGVRIITEKTEGVAGTFTYAHLSEKPLLGDYRDFGSNLPAYEELAKYIYYTETSREWEIAGMNRESGRIGVHAGVSYYLLYTRDAESDWKLDLDFLNRELLTDPNRNIVIYHEKFWMHREQLRNWEKEHDKHVRSMQIPFQMR